MKWFCALSEKSPQFDTYARMIKVAVYTAQTRTTLEPHFLYDGEPCALTDWLTERGVIVHPCRSRFRPLLTSLADSFGMSDINGVAGVFLRAELPGLMHAQGYPDRYTLYTDCDVLFRQDVVPVLQTLAPRVFTVAPEFSQTDWRGINTGVMLMNLDRLRADEAAWTRFTARHMAHWRIYSWDQAAYLAFYHPVCRFLMDRGLGYRWAASAAHRLDKVFRPRWDRLPLALNWKPYWGASEEAMIIHFHGSKPTMTAAGGVKQYGYHGVSAGDYVQMRQEWRALLKEADPAEDLPEEPGDGA